MGELIKETMKTIVIKAPKWAQNKMGARELRIKALKKAGFEKLAEMEDHKIMFSLRNREGKEQKRINDLIDEEEIRPLMEELSKKDRERIEVINSLSSNMREVGHEYIASRLILENPNKFEGKPLSSEFNTETGTITYKMMNSTFDKTLQSIKDLLAD